MTVMTATAPITSRSPETSREALALLAVAACSVAVLWFGGAAAGGLATASVIGSPRTHATLGGLASDSPPANYGQAFEYVVAPLRKDAASTIKSVRVEMRELLPLRWGWGVL